MMIDDRTRTYRGSISSPRPRAGICLQHRGGVSPPTRHGGVYPLVLIVSAAAATAALTGLAVRQATDDRQQTIADLAGARLIARSGIEATLQVIAEDTEWRKNFGASRTIDYTISPGTTSVLISDETDSDLSDDDTDPYTLTSTAVAGDATTTLRVTVETTPDSYRARALAADPIRYWPIDETTGFIASDLTGNGDGGYSNPGALNGTTGYDGGPAMLMDSALDYAWAPHSDDLLIDEGTVMCWVLCNGDITGDQTIFAKTRGDGEQGDLLVTLKWGSLDIVVSYDDGDSRTSDELNLGVIKPGDWTHIAITFGDGLRCYLNGAPKNANPSIQGGWGTEGGTAPGNTHNMQFGIAWLSLIPEDVINGSVRDVTIYDTALSEAEIWSILNEPTRVFCIDPDAWAWVVD